MRIIITFGAVPPLEERVQLYYLIKIFESYAKPKRNNVINGHKSSRGEHSLPLPSDTKKYAKLKLAMVTTTLVAKRA